MPFDGSSPDKMEHVEFQQTCDWQEVFPDAFEELPRRCPKPTGDKLHITCYVDADHARNRVTRRSVTGIMLLINNTPLVWISRRQRTVETSTFGSEVIAARTAIDLIVEMRYKLRSISLRVQPQSTLIGDNLSVIMNTTSPASKIRKKHLSCQIMRVQEAVAADIVRFGHICSEHNAANALTKPLGSLAFHQSVHHYLFRHLKRHTDETTAPKPCPFNHTPASQKKNEATSKP